METKLEELGARLAEINDLESAAGLLGWDQNTYMPPGGAPARARQIATLQRLAHEKFSDAGDQPFFSLSAFELNGFKMGAFSTGEIVTGIIVQHKTKH